MRVKEKKTAWQGDGGASTKHRWLEAWQPLGLGGECERGGRQSQDEYDEDCQHTPSKSIQERVESVEPAELGRRCRPPVEPAAPAQLEPPRVRESSHV